MVSGEKKTDIISNRILCQLYSSSSNKVLLCQCKAFLLLTVHLMLFSSNGFDAFTCFALFANVYPYHLGSHFFMYVSAARSVTACYVTRLCVCMRYSHIIVCLFIVPMGTGDATDHVRPIYDRPCASISAPLGHATQIQLNHFSYEVTFR